MNRRLCCTALFATCSALHGQSFNVDFGGTQAPSSTYAADGSAGVWNLAPNGDLIPQPLLGLDGSPLGVTITTNVPGFSNQFDNPDVTGDDELLLDDRIYIIGSGADELVVDVDGLEPGLYRVNVYSWYSVSEHPFQDISMVRIDAGLGAFAGTTTISGLWPGRPLEGITHVEEGIQLGASVEITIVGSFLGSSAFLNGLQFERLDDGVYCQYDYGFGGPGTGELRMCGELLAPAGLAELRLDGLAPFTPFYFANGFKPDPTPLLGGTLVPISPTALGPLPTDGTGSFAIPLTGATASLIGAHLQALWIDPGLPQGVGFSNAITIDTLPY